MKISATVHGGVFHVQETEMPRRGVLESQVKSVKTLFARLTNGTTQCILEVETLQGEIIFQVYDFRGMFNSWREYTL